MPHSLKPKWWAAGLLAVAFLVQPVLTGSTAELGSHLPRLPVPGQEALTPDWDLVPSLTDVDLASFSAIVVSLPQGEIVGALEPSFPLSLASLTKVMSAVVTLESKAKLDSPLAFVTEDNTPLLNSYVAAGDRVSRLYVKNGDQVLVKDVLAAALIGSANNAAAALVRASSLSEPQFVERMNQRAAILGMTNTVFTEPTGLDPDNIGTVYDYAMLARYAWQNRLLRELGGMVSYSLTTLSGEKHKINNTNPLVLRPRADFIPLSSKTGYLEEAGYNLAFEFRTQQGKSYLVVLMNAPTAADRTADMLKVIDWLESRV